MNKLFSLTKVLMLEQFKTAFGKAPAKKKSLNILFTFAIVALVLGSLSFNLYQQYEVYKMLNMTQFILYDGLLYVGMIFLFYFSLQIYNMFFESKDFEFLASMPIKGYQIITAKILSLLIVVYAFQFVILVPAFVFFCLNFALKATTFIYFIIGFFALPFFMFLLAGLMSYIISFVSMNAKNKKRAKQATTYVLFALIIGLVLYVSFMGTNIYTNAQLPLVFKIVFPTNFLLYEAIVANSFVYFLLFLFGSCLSFALMVLILAKVYFKSNQRRKENVKIEDTKEVSFEQKPVLKGLFNLEFKNFITRPLYVINAGFGSILLILASVGLPIFFVWVVSSGNGALISLKETVLSIFMFLALALVMLNITTNSAVSIEGESFYYKKSLPISFRKQMFAKILVNMVLFIPVITLYLAAIPFMIYSYFTIIEAILPFFILALAQIFVATTGLYINLLFPKLDWKNETAVVKQSISTFVSIMLSIAILTGLIALTTKLMTLISLVYVLLILFAIFVVLNAIIISLLLLTGEKLHNRI